jgi:L-Ala-D/L-Glu epimerase
MNVVISPYRLVFKFPFRIAHGMRTHTDAVFVTLSQDGITATGEATLPPYLPDTQQGVIDYLHSLPLDSIVYPFDPAVVFDTLVAQYPGCLPGLAALDMALWSYHAKAQKQSLRALMSLPETDTTPRTYTIAVCDRIEMQERVAYGRSMGFSLFKLKLDGQSDRQMIADYSHLVGGRCLVDANQSWHDLDYAVEMSYILSAHDCVLIEQPFDREDVLLTPALRKLTTLPILADEACQRLADIPALATRYDGINIKLQKCGGITEASRMIQRAKAYSLQVIIGCMSESIIGCTAADSLSPLCDWCDLDGRYLIHDVPFEW